MKISFSRSAVLAAIAVVILVSALPGTIRRIIQSGDLYLFTRQFFLDLWARLSGPGRFAVHRASRQLQSFWDCGTVKRDSRTGHPPFILGLVLHGAHRRALWGSAVVSVRDLVAIAIILDVISQLLIFREFIRAQRCCWGPY